jgi:hypothetical protein
MASAALLNATLFGAPVSAVLASYPFIAA